MPHQRPAPPQEPQPGPARSTAERHPPRPSRRRPVRRTATTALVLLALLGGAAFLPGQAAAAPQKSTVSKRIDQLNQQVDVATEDYDEARIALTAAEKRTKALDTRARKQRQAAEQLRRSVAALAMAAYTGGDSDLAGITAVAGAKSPQDAVDRASSLARLSDENANKVTSYRKASRDLATKRQAAARSLKRQRQVAHRMAQKKDEIVGALSEQRRLLAQLLAAERRAAERRERAQRAERERHQRQARHDDNGSNGGGGGGSDQGHPPTNLPPASGRAARAIAFARSQLGKPYQWGADGPGSYDCSGLTMRSWGAAGVSLPHSSRAQAGAGPQVGRSQLQPGDLVFFGSPIHHVGLYVGGHKMIDAPHTGAVVRYSDLDESYYRSEWAGAVRPG